MTRSKPRPEGPFWPVNEPGHRARVVDALLADDRVQLDRASAETLAALTTTRASELLLRGGALRDGLFRQHTFPDGEWVRTLKIRTTFELPWWHNTRTEAHWADASAPVRPWPAVVDSDGVEVATLHTACGSFDQAVELVRYAADSLREENSDRKRRYSLKDDMAASGQEHSGIAVLHRLSWPDPASGARRDRTVLARVLGNSRAAVRLDLLGLSSVDAAFGVPLRVFRGAPAGTERNNELVGAAPAVVEDAADAWNRLMGAYELAADTASGHAVLPDGYERLAEADLAAVQRMADVVTEIVVAASDPARLLELAQKANVRDHLRGNQDLEEEARLLALGSEILDAHRRRGTITRAEVIALYGAAPPTVFAPGADTWTAEAARRARLLELIFPTTDGATRAVGAVMGEPTNRQLVKGAQINQRARVFTALATRGTHNPRAGESMFNRSQGMSGVQLPPGDVGDWLDAAHRDPRSPEAEALLGPLGVIWLVEAGLYGAPRGSDPSGRRTASDVMGALRADRVRAIGLVRELLYTQSTRRACPRVDERGAAIPDTEVSRAWFDETFPPVRRRGQTSTEPESTAGPPATPDALLTGAKSALEGEISQVAGFGTTLAEKVDAIVDLCDEHGLELDESWVLHTLAAVDDMVNAVEARSSFRRLRSLVADR